MDKNKTTYIGTQGAFLHFYTQTNNTQRDAIVTPGSLFEIVTSEVYYSGTTSGEIAEIPVAHCFQEPFSYEDSTEKDIQVWGKIDTSFNQQKGLTYHFNGVPVEDFRGSVSGNLSYLERAILSRMELLSITGGNLVAIVLARQTDLIQNLENLRYNFIILFPTFSSSTQSQSVLSETKQFNATK
jgi:hypothetical protein